MSRPENLKQYPNVDLKLGIKSSLPHVKSTLALSYLMWECTNNPSELQYSKAENNGIVVTNEVLTCFKESYGNILSSAGISEAMILSTINSNQLFKSQMEALIVAFELIWRIAEINFVDTSKPASAERSGGNRYPKKLNYTINADMIKNVINGNRNEYIKVLLAWTGFAINYSNTIEKSLLSVFSLLSENAIFKLDDNGTDIIFNQNSLYESVLKNESVDINGDSEAKGSLRILKSLLSESMNPFLEYSNGSVSVEDGNKELLKEYSGRVNTFLKISNIRIENIVAADEESNGEREKGGENVILYGVPGAGKSWTIKNEYCKNDALIERLVFHPDYTYSDFVGQILPKLDDNSNVSYVFTPGPFTKILKKAYNDPTNSYYLVIEEVNRGNAPAIFGDVFQLLDRDGNGSSEYSITNSDIAKEVYGDENHKVSIPSNLSILGTMNTSDQNVFTLDTAFQRRWSMRLIENKFDKNSPSDVEFANTKILDTEVTWEKFFTEINSIILNKNIRMTSSEDKRLGTHFVQIEDLKFNDYDGRDNNLLKNATKHNRKFAEKVLKYLWDDAFKFNKDEIFDIKEMNSLEKVITTFMSEKGNARFEKILKQNIYDALVPKKVE